MQIAIDIPKEIYNLCVKNDYFFYNETDTIRQAIANGTPLPKGHGRLIDADKLEYTCNSDECGMLTGCNHCQYHVITEDELDNTPTIIEADKEGKDEL